MIQQDFASQEIARELDRLEFEFQEAQKIGSERVDQLTARVAELAEEARRFAEEAAPGETAERAAALCERLDKFRGRLVENARFFAALAQLDAASLNADDVQSFFASFLSQNDDATLATPDLNNRSQSFDASNASPDFVEFRAELERAATSLDALRTLDAWNEFVEKRGGLLERFYVAPETAEIALDFIARHAANQGVPREFKILERRTDEWRFAARNRVAIQRKIILALEEKLATKYWTFAATPDKIYYLKRQPRPGRNAFVADAQGALAVVEIPATAPETASNVSTQHQFLQELVNDARSIPESLRSEDAARWYAAWSKFLSRLQTSEALDPLVRFELLRSTTATLAAGDYYFARRLAPTLRMLDVSALEKVDVFKTERVETQALRRLAKTRVDFLPKDRLAVDKTTAQLDAQTPKFSFVYRQVGWLDRDFSGAWRCRRPENAPLPIGDLYVLLSDAKGATDEISNAYHNSSSSRFRWLKIGSSDGRRTTLEFAAPEVCRGSIVLCRSRVDSTPVAAQRDELERLMRR
ncbi:MAG: hypothetical protein IKU86_13180 [Thermoguttaceae bacterium]|nr:hypothetical protein [Thermoguttaceae bacterium]